MHTKMRFLLLNMAHFLDHLFMLVFATVAALALVTEWQASYAELIPYATPGFVAFGLFALPAGWLADRWSRHGMMVVFFVGIGVAAIATGMAGSPLQIGLGLFCIGVFAAIYHPVGIALVLEGQQRTGLRVAVNGVWGNMGVAVAALLTAYFIDRSGWRAAFVVPGIVSCGLGLVYWGLMKKKPPQTLASGGNKKPASAADHGIVLRILAVVFFTTALGGLVFQSTTFALPRILAERVSTVEQAATFIGQLAFFAFAAGSMGQLVVGYLLDRHPVAYVFMTVAAMQVLFFGVAITAQEGLAIFAAVGYMVAAFGQIPINDVLIGRIAAPALRSRILAVRYTITFVVMASTLPLIAWIHATHGFSLLFKVLAGAAALIFVAVCTLRSSAVNLSTSSAAG